MNLSAWAPAIPRPQRRAILGAVERVLGRLLLPVEEGPQGRLEVALTAFLGAHESAHAPCDHVPFSLEATPRLR